MQIAAASRKGNTFALEGAGGSIHHGSCVRITGELWVVDAIPSQEVPALSTAVADMIV
jgi:hypothetical protein